MNSSWQHVTVDDSNMRVYVSAPDTTKHVPGVIAVHGGKAEWTTFLR